MIANYVILHIHFEGEFQNRYQSEKQKEIMKYF